MVISIFLQIDVYSYGVLLCEMVTRESPNPQERERQQAMVTDIDIAALIDECLNKRPKKRPTMNEIISELNRIAEKKGFDKI